MAVAAVNRLVRDEPLVPVARLGGDPADSIGRGRVQIHRRVRECLSECVRPAHPATDSAAADPRKTVENLQRTPRRSEITWPGTPIAISPSSQVGTRSNNTERATSAAPGSLTSDVPTDFKAIPTADP